MTVEPYPSVFIFTALECEAKPFIQYFNLKKEQNNMVFSRYSHGSIILTISGIGKTAMAAAVAHTFALFPKARTPVIINIGIAGHKSQPIGDLFLASKVSDNDSGKRFYPHLMGNNLPLSCEVITSSKPCTNYNLDALADMEASAFYEVAVKFSSNELIHCIKVISDNESKSIKDIRPSLVIEWISCHLASIDHLIQHWSKLSQLITPAKQEAFTGLVEKHHFSVSSQIKLKALLQRWYVLSASSWATQNSPTTHSKEILKQLDEDIKNLELHL
jgi:hypothetical protein